MIGIILGAWAIKKMGISRINWIYKKPSANKESKCSSSNSVIANTFNKLKP